MFVKPFTPGHHTSANTTHTYASLSSVLPCLPLCIQYLLCTITIRVLILSFAGHALSPSFRTLETNAHRPSFFAKPGTKLMHPAHIRWDQYLHRALELSAEPLAHTRFHLAPACKNSQKNTVHDQKSTRLVGCPCPSLLRLSGNETKRSQPRSLVASTRLNK